MTEQPKPTFSDFTARAEAEARKYAAGSAAIFDFSSALLSAYSAGAQFGYDEAQREIERLKEENVRVRAIEERLKAQIEAIPGKADSLTENAVIRFILERVLDGK